MRISAGIVAISLVLVLAGCAPKAVEPSPDSSTPASTSKPTKTATPTPKPTPTQTVAAPAPAPSGELTPETAYQACVAKAIELAKSTPDQYVNVPFADSEVVLRTDGNYWVYSELSDYRASPELVDAGATHCVLGGTIADPFYYEVGQIVRSLRPQMDPNQPVGGN